MIKKSLLAVVALSLMMCGNAFGQFVPIKPSDIGQASGGGPVNDIFDISALLGQSANTTSMRVANGYVSATTDAWTVSETESTTFILGGPGMVEAFVNHGANLGGSIQNGSAPRDGISAASGETWTLTSSLDSDYTAGQSGADYFIDYTGSSDQLESNSSGFRWASNQPVTSFSVFSTNTVDLNNNYNVGFQVVNAVPEPAAGMILALAGMVALRRKRS